MRAVGCYADASSRSERFARMDQLLKSDPRLADAIGRDDGDTA